MGLPFIPLVWCNTILLICIYSSIYSIYCIYLLICIYSRRFALQEKCNVNMNLSLCSSGFIFQGGPTRGKSRMRTGLPQVKPLWRTITAACLNPLCIAKMPRPQQSWNTWEKLRIKMILISSISADWIKTFAVGHVKYFRCWQSWRKIKTPSTVTHC